jgi:hypothetical protein
MRIPLVRDGEPCERGTERRGGLVVQTGLVGERVGAGVWRVRERGHSTDSRRKADRLTAAARYGFGARDP